MPEPDYYRILQVHPEADPDVIEAAYRRLIKKYHPDALDPSRRDDPGIQQMIRDINAAYEVLGDPSRRAGYDAGRGGGAAQVAPSGTVEKRTIPGRCSKTRKSFDIVLARKRGDEGPFKVVGFTPVEPENGLAVREGGGPLALIDRLFQPRTRAQGGFGAPSDEELEAMFDEGNQLNFADIHWGNMICPVCSGEAKYPDGTPSAWAICGACKRVSCMGAAVIAHNVLNKTCPWCGKQHTVTRIGPGGAKSRYNVQTDTGPADRKLLGARPSLPKGGDEEGG